MIEEQNIDELNNEESVNLYAILFKYLAYWPWFIVSVIVCVILAFLYLRYQAPVYNVTAAVLIKEEEQKGGNSATSPLAAIQDLGMLSMTSNFDNEVEILHSRTLIKKAVNELHLYTNIVENRVTGYDIPLYKNSPVDVFMTPEQADKLKMPVTLKMTYTPTGKLTVHAEYMVDTEIEELDKTFLKLPAALPTPVGVINFTPNDSIQGLPKEDVTLTASISSPTATAQGYMGSTSVEATSKTTTIAQINVQNTNKQRGVDFINCLVAFYNRDANDEKNEVAQKTAEFIEERIGIINRELGTAETELADFKQRSGLTDLTSDAQLALSESSRYEQQRMENATQIQLVEFLRNYIFDPKNNDEVIPSNVGLQDQNLTSAIDQYNTMIIERNRLLRTSSENNPAVINMNTGIEAMRHSVQTTVASVLKGLNIAKIDIERQARKYEGRISNAPLQEKEFLSIARQQEIKAALYTMLLQKREENAITLAATANNGRIVEEPLADSAPVSPNKKIILLAALVIGLAIPVAIIYLRSLLKYKIENREDVESITSVPLLAELPHCKMPETGSIVIRENKNEIMEEAFRRLRTNLIFMLENNQKVILFTSTQPSEGKSFVAANTAVSLAFLGKKTLIVGLDIRKPRLSRVFNLQHHAKGITNYLSDPEHVDLADVIQPSGISPNLDVMVGGAIPPNPTELVAREILDRTMEQLKQRYDYIILDTAPIGMVTDTAIISRIADLCVYICRADVTPKAGFRYINLLRDEKKFPKLATVINDIDMNKRKNSYYGYGAKYGYGSKYYSYGSYGYGYGYSDEKKNKR